MDLPAAAVDHQAIVEGHRRQGHPGRRHLLQVRLEPLDVRGQLGADGLVAARLLFGAELGDLLGQGVECLLHPEQAQLLKPLARLHR